MPWSGACLAMVMLQLLSALSADMCVACDEVEAAASGTRLCEACAAEVPERVRFRAPGKVPEAVTEAAALGSYAGACGAMVRRAKYGRDEALARHLARQLAEASRELDAPDVVVAVPSARLRAWWRGLALPEVLAGEVARVHGVSVGRPLARRRWRAQAGLAHRARASNARGAFVASRVGASGLDGAHVLLVDDVLTTGATVSACAVGLLGAGASRVDVLTFAAS